MSWKAHHVYKRWLNLCINDAYREVKYSIEWLIQLPEIIRRRFSLISFITYTTRVSRSHALSIVKALKTGGYLEMYDGHIIEILRPLPERY
ncbi:helix-turn-helix domain-containing protein [Pseudomonas chlororaphis]